MREETFIHSLINIKEVTVKLLEVEAQLGVEENELSVEIFGFSSIE